MRGGRRRRRRSSTCAASAAGSGATRLGSTRLISGRAAMSAPRSGRRAQGSYIRAEPSASPGSVLGSWLQRWIVKKTCLHNR